MGSSTPAATSLSFVLNPAQPLCMLNFFCFNLGANANIQFIAYFDVTERISWVWAIYFAFTLPEVQTFLRSLRIIVFKGQERPTALQFFIPFVFEVSEMKQEKLQFDSHYLNCATKMERKLLNFAPFIS